MLRKLIHRALLFKYSEKVALQKVVENFSFEKQRTLYGHSLAQIFSGQSKALYLKDLKDIALREWPLIQHIFGDRKLFEMQLDKLKQ